MLKKWMILPIAAGFLAVNAGAAVSATSAADMENLKNSAGCYEISTRENLVGFANIVNGTDGYTRNVSACAELTADIHYNETQVVNDALTGLANGTPANVWTPIGTNAKPFTGSFDGKGHTIYGLYTIMSDGWEPALVKKSAGGMVIKNLKIEDSYFLSTGGDGGAFIGDHTAGTATVDNCSFKGVVEVGNSSVHNGGLVGSVANNATVVIKNSSNAGKIVGSTDVKIAGGSVGYVNSGATLTMTNSYDLTGRPIVGMKDTKAKSVTATNVSCVGTNCQQITSDDSKKTKSNISGVTSKESPAAVLDAVVDGILKSGNVDDLNTFFESNGSGVSFEQVTLASGNTGIMAWLKPTKTGESAELSENDSIVIPADVTVDVDKISLDREYKAGILSTVMFPFTIEAKSVKNANFFVFDGVDQSADEWNVNIRPVCNDPDGDGVYEVSACGNNDSIYANRPYFVKILGDASAPLSFADASERGNKKLTIRKTVDADTRVTADSWSLVGVYGFTHWETSPGNVFGYSSKNPELYPEGRFVKAGDNVSVKAMRAYLYYDRPAVSPKPALMKAAAEEIPSELKVCIRGYVEPEIIVETIDPAVGDSEENSTLSIAKPMTAPEAVKANCWYDLNGRRLIKKPANHGSFYNKSVIVK